MDNSDFSGCRAALYIRLSKEDEGEGRSRSVKNQLSLLSDYAAQKNITVADTYIDDGWSGTDFDRPAFRRMISDIESGLVNTVITKDLSRLGRDYIMTGHYMERYFPEHGVRYISLLDGVDTGRELSSNEITPFRAIMNDMYSRDISKKIKSVKNAKQKKGLFIGGRAVFGYKLSPFEKNRLIIDENAAETVRNIFTRAASGESCRSISETLNRESVPSPSVYGNLPRQGPWTGERIGEIIKNQMYTGSMVQGRRRKISYKSKKSVSVPRDRWIVVENTHEPLVDKKTFEAANAMLKSRSPVRCRTYDSVLKGLVFCSECGRPLSLINRKDARGGDVLYFICHTYQKYGRGRCSSHLIKEETLRAAAESALRAVIGPYISKEKLYPEALSALQSRGSEREIAETRKKLNQAEKDLRTAYGDRLSGLLSPSDFESIYSEIKKRRGTLLSSLKTLESSSGSAHDRALHLAEKYVSCALSRRDLIYALAERMELDENRTLKIFFTFPEKQKSGV